MSIVAIGCMPDDLILSCFGTLTKYIKKGKKVVLILAKSNTSQKKIRAFKKLTNEIGISAVHYLDEFDFTAVTQKNVYLIRDIVENDEITLAIIPFNKAKNNKNRILGQSSILACRSVKNVLMYELQKNEEYFPFLYSDIKKQKPMKGRYIKNYSNSKIEEKKIQNKITSLESFQCIRIVMNGNEL